MTLPSSVLLENVTGLRCTDKGSDASPLSMVVNQLQKAGYITDVFDMNLGTWHSAVRQRTSRYATHYTKRDDRQT